MAWLHAWRKRNQKSIASEKQNETIKIKNVVSEKVATSANDIRRHQWRNLGNKHDFARSVSTSMHVVMAVCTWPQKKNQEKNMKKMSKIRGCRQVVMRGVTAKLCAIKWRTRHVARLHRIALRASISHSARKLMAYVSRSACMA